MGLLRTDSRLAAGRNRISQRETETISYIWSMTAAVK